MSRIKIEDLPVVETMDSAEASQTIGGASYRYGPSYRYTPSPVYRPPTPSWNMGRMALPGNDGGSFRRY
jgi:hypothetical protein